jgi:hypothetical protein
MANRLQAKDLSHQDRQGVVTLHLPTPDSQYAIKHADSFLQWMALAR